MNDAERKKAEADIKSTFKQVKSHIRSLEQKNTFKQLKLKIRLLEKLFEMVLLDRDIKHKKKGGEV